MKIPQNPLESPFQFFFQTQKISFNMGAEKTDSSVLTIKRNFNFEMTCEHVF